MNNWYTPKKRLCYDTTYYSELCAAPYLNTSGELQVQRNWLRTHFEARSGNRLTYDSSAKDADRFTTELFGTLIDGKGAKRLENPGEEWAVNCFDMLENSTDWAELQYLCKGKRELSALATASLLKALSVEMAKSRQQQEQKEGGGEIDLGDGYGPGQEAQAARASAAGRRIKEAVKQVAGDAKQMSDAYGTMAGNGFAECQNTAQDYEERARLLKEIRDNEDFRTVVNHVGRMHQIMKAKMAQTEEKQVLQADIEYGSDLRRLSQLESANLAMRETQTLFLKRYSESKLMQRKAKGISNKGRGDIIIMLDQSGSMGGTEETLANAFAVAMVQLASSQKRKIYLLGFNGRVTFVHRYEKQKAYIMSGRTRYHNFETESIEWAEIPVATAIHSVLNMSSNGGTCFGSAMTAALALLEEAKEADLVMVSDANDHMPHEYTEKCNRMKKRLGMRTSALFITPYRQKDMEALHGDWADTLHAVSPSVESMMEGLTDMAVTAIN